MTKNATLKLLLTLAAVLAAPPFAHAAGFGDFDIDPRFRAKIIKERAKQAGESSRNGEKEGLGLDKDNVSCGSQSVGNINTGGRPGSAPREVIIFAPNLINVVTPNACR